jgi:hypothetical protein
MKSNLISALIQAQREFPVIPKGKTAKVPTKSGGSYTYSYADLSDVVAAVTPILHKNGLCVIHLGGVEAGRQTLRTILTHSESDEKAISDFLLPPTDDPQDMGGSITYFRRYALCSILGIVTEDDADGAQKPSAKPATLPKPPQGASSLPKPATGPKPAAKDPGAAVVPFGEIKGTRLDALSDEDLNGIAEWYAKMKEPPKGVAAAFKKDFDAFIEFKFGAIK